MEIKTAIKTAIMDFRNTNYFWPSAWRLFLRVKKEVLLRNGRMVLCNASKQVRKILRHPRLDGQWLFRSSREEAVEETKGEKVSKESGS